MRNNFCENHEHTLQKLDKIEKSIKLKAELEVR